MKVSFGTRLDPSLRQRLKVYAASTDQTIEDVVEAALNGYLPPDDMTVEELNGYLASSMAAHLASKDMAAGEALQLANERDPGAGTPGPQTV